jgi:hypothetical protein
MPATVTSPNTGTIPTLFDTDGASRYLGGILSPATLTRGRCTGDVAIPFVRLNRKVAYRKEDLDAFIAANVAKPGQSVPHE